MSPFHCDIVLKDARVFRIKQVRKYAQKRDPTPGSNTNKNEYLVTLWSAENQRFPLSTQLFLILMWFHDHH